MILFSRLAKVKLNTYQKNNMDYSEFLSHVRLRPGMYLGATNLRGFIACLKLIISNQFVEKGAKAVVIDIKNDIEGNIQFLQPDKPYTDSYMEKLVPYVGPTHSLYDLQIFNALCAKFSIQFCDAQGHELLKQEFEKGKLVRGDKDGSTYDVQQLIISYQLDPTIWKDFVLPISVLLHSLEDFAYLHRRQSVQLKYKVDGHACKVHYAFHDGLMDRLKIEKWKGLGNTYFDTHLIEQIDGIKLEIAFAFRDYWVDQPFLRSYVNAYPTTEHGSHMDALLNGLVYGTMRYFQKHKLTEQYKISEKGIAQRLVGLIHVSMDEPLFSGCVKNKLANPEIITPIADFVATTLFQKLEMEPNSTEKLIQLFEINRLE